MALQIDYKTKFGIDVTGAYVSVVNYRGAKNGMGVTVFVHKDHAAKIARLQPLDQLNFDLKIENGATYKQMYDALKLLPEFGGAVDV